jgi:hypothetical protein
LVVSLGRVNDSVLVSARAEGADVQDKMAAQASIMARREVCRCALMAEIPLSACV